MGSETRVIFTKWPDNKLLAPSEVPTAQSVDVPAPSEAPNAQSVDIPATSVKPIVQPEDNVALFVDQQQNSDSRALQATYSVSPSPPKEAATQSQVSPPLCEVSRELGAGQAGGGVATVQTQRKGQEEGAAVVSKSAVEVGAEEEVKVEEVKVGVGEEVKVGVGEEMKVGVGEEVKVGVGEEVKVGVGEEVKVGVGEEVKVGVGEEVKVGVGEEVKVGVGEEVRVGLGEEVGVVVGVREEGGSEVGGGWSGEVRVGMGDGKSGEDKRSPVSGGEDSPALVGVAKHETTPLRGRHICQAWDKGQSFPVQPPPEKSTVTPTGEPGEMLAVEDIELSDSQQGPEGSIFEPPEHPPQVRQL